MSITPGPATVRLGGPLRSHLAAAAEQLNRSTPYSVDVVVQDVRWAPGQQRIFQDYRGDLSGRYLDAVSVAHAEGLPVDADKVAAVLREVLSAQQPDGLFGPPAPAVRIDHGTAWGHGRLLDGLLSARTWASGESIAAVDRAAALLAEAIGARAEQWARWTREAGRQKFRLDPLSAVLPMARFAETADSKSALYAARTLAEALPADVDGVHMHGYLLALRGQLEVGRLTGTDDLVHGVRERVETVAERYVLPHGGVPESVTLPWDVNTEGCGVADWVMLNVRLYSLFGDHHYLDRATSSAFNALLHTQRATGHFGCETLSGEDGLLVSDYAPEAWWCCTLHGIRALRELAEQAVTMDDDVVRVHLPVALTLAAASADADPDPGTVPGSVAGSDAGPGSVAGTDATTGSNLVVGVDGGYPYDDRVIVTVGPAFRHAALHLRVPSTATLSGLVVDGERLDVTAADGWVKLPGLRPGARVSLVLNQHEWFSVGGEAVLPPFANTTTRLPDLSTTRCAAYRGPLLMAAHAPDNSVEDLLRSQCLVHPPSKPRFDRNEDGDVAAAAAGHDSFRAPLRLTALAGADRARNDRPVRAWFHGLLFADRDVHGSAGR